MGYLIIYDHINLKCDDMNFTRDHVSFTCRYNKSTCELSGFCVGVFYSHELFKSCQSELVVNWHDSCM